MIDGGPIVLRPCATDRTISRREGDRLQRESISSMAYPAPNSSSRAWTVQGGSGMLRPMCTDVVVNQLLWQTNWPEQQLMPPFPHHQAQKMDHTGDLWNHEAGGW